MKIKLTELIKSGDISPFKWGDSDEDFLNIFPEWKNRIMECKKAKSPFIEIDSVEFYFENDFYKGLNSVVIGVWHFDKDYESNYFDNEWIQDNLSLPQVKDILKNKKWTYEELSIQRSNEPYLLTNRFTQFAFDSTDYGDYEENKTELQKIFINPEPVTDDFVNGKGNKITLYNNGSRCTSP